MNGAQGASAAEGPASGAVTIVTQTRVRPESADAFARWQEETSAVVARSPGFIKQTVLPPSPPAQVDWVILQRFVNRAAAMAWLNSEQRLKRVEGISAMLVGLDDINIVHDGATGVVPSPVSAVISTRVKSGQKIAYRAWEQWIALHKLARRAFRAIASSRRFPACKITGSPSCASTQKQPCKRGSIPLNVRSCCARQRRSRRSFTPGSRAPASINGSKSRPPDCGRCLLGSRTCSSASPIN